jgi:hypothetical protein
MKFVVQEHFATHHHFDLRLQSGKELGDIKNHSGKEGKEEISNIDIEDHTIEYMDFEGGIVRGCGTGGVSIWDQGDYELIRRNERKR